jgi:hypothetical protein
MLAPAFADEAVAPADWASACIGKLPLAIDTTKAPAALKKSRRVAPLADAMLSVVTADWAFTSFLN